MIKFSLFKKKMLSDLEKEKKRKKGHELFPCLANQQMMVANIYIYI